MSGNKWAEGACRLRCISAKYPEFMLILQHRSEQVWHAWMVGGSGSESSYCLHGVTAYELVFMIVRQKRDQEVQDSRMGGNQRAKAPERISRPAAHQFVSWLSLARRREGRSALDGLRRPGGRTLYCVTYGVTHPTHFILSCQKRTQELEQLWLSGNTCPEMAYGLRRPVARRLVLLLVGEYRGEAAQRLWWLPASGPRPPIVRRRATPRRPSVERTGPAARPDTRQPHAVEPRILLLGRQKRSKAIK
jgi:hypothetical protein